MAWAPAPGISLRDAFNDVMKKITHRDWNRFARTGLGLEQVDIDEIGVDFCNQAKEQKYRMLERWSEIVGSEASVEYLYDVLNHYLFPEECPLPVLQQEACIPESNFCNFNPDERYVAMDCEHGGSFEPEIVEQENTLDLMEYCSKVGDIIVLPSTQDFYDRNVNSFSNYSARGQKGNVLIINNSFSHCSQSYREGSEVDVKNMTILWQKLGCDVKVYKDIIARDVRLVLRNFSDQSADHDCCVVLIMSHGTSDDGYDVVLGNDGEKIRVQEILEAFNNKNSPRLQGKPKLFFFQCCRGDETDPGVTVGDCNSSVNCPPSRTGNDTNVSVIPAQKEDRTVTDVSPVSARLPTVSDMLVMYATQHGQQAFRNTETGSWFINAIVNVFMRHAKDNHVLDMMVKVNRAVATKASDSREDGYAKAMSNIEFTLTKNLYLFPGLLV